MYSEESTSNRDKIIIVVLVDFLGILFLLFTDAIGGAWKLLGITSLLFCLVVAALGKDRKIGVVGAFFISFFLSPLIGLIITLGSSRIIDEEYMEKMLENSDRNAGASTIADQLHILNELRKEGVLTDAEFAAQKEKLLST